MKSIKFLLFCWLFIGLSSCKTTINNVAGTYISSVRNNPHKLNIDTAHKFVINADSTFNYYYIVAGDTVKYCDGRWSRVDKNTIVLNSKITNNIIPIHIEKIDTEDPQIQICEDLNIIQKKSCYEYKSEDFLVTPYVDGNNYLDLHPELSDDSVRLTKNDYRRLIGLKPDTTSSSDIVIVCPPEKRGSYCIYPEKPFSNLYFKIKKQPKMITNMGIQPSYYNLQTEKINVQVQPGDLIKVTICLNDSLFSYRIFNSEKIKVDGKNLIFIDKEDNSITNKLLIK